MPLVAAAVVSAVVVAVLNVLARRIGAVARCTDDHWRTAESIPHLGGPGLLLAMLPWFPVEQGLILAAFCAIGTIDDIRPLSPAAKALLLVLPSAAAGWSSGEIWVAVAAWFVANAVNLLDHADGLAATVAAVGFAFGGTPAALAAAGACLGFLFHNFPPARSFMGDGGSLVLGAGLVLVWQGAGPALTLAWCAVPLLDAVFVTVRRVASGRKPWIGGRDHSGHVLLRMGCPPRLLPLAFGAAAALAGFGTQSMLSSM